MGEARRGETPTALFLAQSDNICVCNKICVCSLRRRPVRQSKHLLRAALLPVATPGRMQLQMSDKFLFSFMASSKRGWTDVLLRSFYRMLKSTDIDRNYQFRI